MDVQPTTIAKTTMVRAGVPSRNSKRVPPRPGQVRHGRSLVTRVASPWRRRHLRSRSGRGPFEGSAVPVLINRLAAILKDVAVPSTLMRAEAARRCSGNCGPWSRRSTRRRPRPWNSSRSPRTLRSGAVDSISTRPAGRATTSGWAALRKHVLSMAGGRCRWCGGVATVADHVQPVSEGGADVVENVVASCVRCNGARRNARMAQLAMRAIGHGLHLPDTATGGGPPPPPKVPTGRRPGSAEGRHTARAQPR